MKTKRKQLFDVCILELKPVFTFSSHLEYVWHFVNVVFNSKIDEDTECYEIPARYTKSGKPVVVYFERK